MNIEQTIKRLQEFAPFIMPQIELFEDIKLVQQGTGSMTTIEFTGHNTARQIRELEHRVEMAEEDAESEKSRSDRLNQDASDLRKLIRESIQTIPPGILDKYEHTLKANCIDRPVTQEKKVQGDQAGTSSPNRQ